MKPFPRNENAEAEICFGDGNDVAASVLKKGYRCGIEIAEPSMGYLDVYEKHCLVREAPCLFLNRCSTVSSLAGSDLRLNC